MKFDQNDGRINRCDSGGEFCVFLKPEPKFQLNRFLRNFLYKNTGWWMKHPVQTYPQFAHQDHLFQFTAVNIKHVLKSPTKKLRALQPGN